PRPTSKSPSRSGTLRLISAQRRTGFSLSRAGFPSGSRRLSSRRSILKILLKPREYFAHVRAAVLTFQDPLPFVRKHHQPRRNFASLQDLERGHALVDRHAIIQLTLRNQCWRAERAGIAQWTLVVPLAALLPDRHSHAQFPIPSAVIH